MTGYTIPLTCPHCGALMAHTAGDPLPPRRTPRMRPVVEWNPLALFFMGFALSILWQVIR